MRAPITCMHRDMSVGTLVARAGFFQHAVKPPIPWSNLSSTVRTPRIFKF